jgi:hypothetical protein
MFSKCRGGGAERIRSRQVDSTELALLQSFANCATTISLDTSECEDTLQTGSDLLPSALFPICSVGNDRKCVVQKTKNQYFGNA